MEKTKILFTGIDNGGKSSIIKFLKRELTLDQKSVPTIGDEISIQALTLLGLSIIYWELGGQVLYRKKYFDDIFRYFSSTSLMICVIDIKDEKRYEESLEYLKTVLNNLKVVSAEEKANPKIMILFHKFDPNLMNKEDYEKKYEDLKKRILDFNPFKEISFYKTSIYDGVSLIKAFSEAAINLKGKTKLLQNLLKEYCSKTFASAAMIFDKNFLVVDQRATKETYFDIIQAFTLFFINGIEQLESHSIETIDVVSEIKFPGSDSKSTNNRGTIFIQKIDIGVRLYLVVLSRNPKTKKQAYEYLDYLAENLKKILS